MRVVSLVMSSDWYGRGAGAGYNQHADLVFYLSWANRPRHSELPDNGCPEGNIICSVVEELPGQVHEFRNGGQVEIDPEPVIQSGGP